MATPGHVEIQVELRLSDEARAALIALGWRPPADDLDEVACVLCGCTENAGCEGGCAWLPNPLGVDICTDCAAQLAAVILAAENEDLAATLATIERAIAVPTAGTTHVAGDDKTLWLHCSRCDDRICGLEPGLDAVMQALAHTAKCPALLAAPEPPAAFTEALGNAHLAETHVETHEFAQGQDGGPS